MLAPLLFLDVGRLSVADAGALVRLRLHSFLTSRFVTLSHNQSIPEATAVSIIDTSFDRPPVAS